jgi:hypothetical protein
MELDISGAYKGLTRFARDFDSLASALSKIAPSISGVVGWLAGDVVPPWPSAATSKSIVVVVIVSMTVLAAVVWNDHLAVSVARWRLNFWAAAFVFATISYLYLWQSYVEVFPDQQDEHIVTGFIMHDLVGQMADSDPSFYTPAELLDRNERDPERVWTKSSVSIVRIALLITWTVAWLAPLLCVNIYLARWRLEHPLVRDSSQ